MEASVDGEALARVRALTAAEGPTLAQARIRAGQAMPLPSPETGALLRWAATATGARTVVEIGAAGGVSGLWLLQGMAERGVLTSVEFDPHHHALASSAYADAGATGRVRSILGEPTSVLPRLSDGGYDLCLVQARPSEYPEYLTHALRLLRSGGLLVARDVLRSPADEAEELARFHQALAEEESLTSTVLPVDGGLALATLR